MAQVKYDKTMLQQLRGLYNAAAGVTTQVPTNQQSVAKYVFLIDEVANPTKIANRNSNQTNAYKAIIDIFKSITSDFLKKAIAFASIDSKLAKDIKNVSDKDLPEAKNSYDFVNILYGVYSLLEEYLSKDYYAEPSHQRAATDLNLFINTHLITVSKNGFFDAYKSIPKQNLNTTIDSGLTESIAGSTSDDDFEEAEEKARKDPEEARLAEEADEEDDEEADEEAEARRKADEEAEARRKADEEAEAKRKADEAEAKRKADEEAEKSRKEAEVWRNIEATRNQKYAEASRKKALEDARLLEEMESKKAAADRAANEKAKRDAEAKVAAEKLAAENAARDKIDNDIKKLQNIETGDIHFSRKIAFINEHLSRSSQDREAKFQIMMNVVEKKQFLGFSTTKSVNWVDITISQYCQKVLADCLESDTTLNKKTKTMELNHAIGLLEYVDIKDVYGTNPNMMMQKIKALPPSIKLATEIAYIEHQLTENHASYQSQLRVNKKTEQTAKFIHDEMEHAYTDLYDGKIESGLAHIEYCVNAIHHDDVVKAGIVIDIAALHHI